MSDSFDSMFTRGTNLTNFFNAKGLRLNRVDPNSPYEEAEYIRWNPKAYRSVLEEAVERAKAQGNLTEEQERIIRAMERGIEPENIVWTGTMVVDKSEVRWSKAEAEKVAYSYGDVLYAFGVIDKQTAQACQTVAGIRRSEEAKRQNVTGNYLVDEYISPLLPQLPGELLAMLGNGFDSQVFITLAQDALTGLTDDKVQGLHNDPRYEYAIKTENADMLMELYEEYNLVDEFRKYLKKVL